MENTGKLVYFSSYLAPAGTGEGLDNLFLNFLDTTVDEIALKMLKK
jgi:hypothetical protein